MTFVTLYNKGMCELFVSQNYQCSLHFFLLLLYFFLPFFYIWLSIPPTGQLQRRRSNRFWLRFRTSIPDIVLCLSVILLVEIATHFFYFYGLAKSASIVKNMNPSTAGESFFAKDLSVCSNQLSGCVRQIYTLKCVSLVELSCVARDVYSSSTT